tara:strand:- start:18887 stop:19330 length:444 start_codon:yes stop_codon:yes gene_type:complete
MKRREFISSSVKLAGACALGCANIIKMGCANEVEADFGSSGEDYISLDISDGKYNALQNDGGSIVISGNQIDPKGLLLVRVGENIYAYSNSCTHSGYELGSFQNGISTCTQHGATFNASGKAISGPASGSLRSYPTELVDNTLRIFP